jgi:predicted Rossmann fold nucleotide-binding protein DprA/Smf involved in DNA uptake
MEKYDSKTLPPGIRLLLPDDPDFPYLLTQLAGILPPHEMPKRLFVEGTLPPCDRSAVARDNRSTEMKYLCVVGARRHSSYGREVCERLIAGLAGYNICIVSGLALGIDSIAHEAALDAGLPTIAFPGSGLNRDVIYPARSQRLARRIVEAGTDSCANSKDAAGKDATSSHYGALVSEFDMDFHATDWSFPQRNRLMAGISHATLVIEAKLKSGTLITARMANDYNREVFAVPGSIFSSLSDGPNWLIHTSRAAIVRSSEDILIKLGLKEEKELDKNGHEINGCEMGDEDNDENEGKNANRQKENSNIACTDEEKKILDILNGPMEKDRLIREIAATLGKSVSETNATLSMMEISGMIVEEGGMVREGSFC